LSFWQQQLAIAIDDNYETQDKYSYIQEVVSNLMMLDAKSKSSRLLTLPFMIRSPLYDEFVFSCITCPVRKVRKNTNEYYDSIMLINKDENTFKSNTFSKGPCMVSEIELESSINTTGSINVKWTREYSNESSIVMRDIDILYEKGKVSDETTYVYRLNIDSMLLYRSTNDNTDQRKLIEDLSHNMYKIPACVFRSFAIGIDSNSEDDYATGNGYFDTLTNKIYGYIYDYFMDSDTGDIDDTITTVGSDDYDIGDDNDYDIDNEYQNNSFNDNDDDIAVTGDATATTTTIISDNDYYIDNGYQNNSFNDNDDNIAVTGDATTTTITIISFYFISFYFVMF